MNKHHPLGELIQSAQDKNGWSVRDLQRRAEDLGFEMKHSNFSRLKLHEVVTVKGDVIRMLAKVLALPEPMVARAALASMGIDMASSDTTVDEAVRTSTEFSERDRRIIQAVVDTMRSDVRSGPDATKDEQPINPRTGRPFRRGSAEALLRTEGQRRDASPGQKTESLPDHLPVQFGGSTAARVSIVMTELRKRYGLENGRLPEDWRESIIGSGLWEDAAAPFLTGQLGQHLVKEQFLNRLIDQLEKADATDSTGALAVDYPDNNIPLPKEYLELAAHPDVESSGRREHEAGRERGEESQDTETH